MVFAAPTRLRAGAWVGDACGAAAARAEATKRRACLPGPHGRPALLIPFAAEAGGRLGAAAEAELQRLAKLKVDGMGEDPCAADQQALHARAAVLARWRQEASCASLKGNWMVVAAATDGLAPAQVRRGAPSSLPSGLAERF